MKNSKATETKKQELLKEVSKLAPKLAALRQARDKIGYYEENDRDDFATLATAILLDVVELEKGDDSIVRSLSDNLQALLDHVHTVADSCEGNA